MTVLKTRLKILRSTSLLFKKMKTSNFFLCYSKITFCIVPCIKPTVLSFVKRPLFHNQSLDVTIEVLRVTCTK